MERWVDIAFDCMPLRTVTRMDIPIDASPKYRAFCERVKQAIEKHGSHNSYYLYHAHCCYRLVNHEETGAIRFRFEGTVLTDETDQHCKTCDLNIELVGETCDWLTQPIVTWFGETVSRSVAVEFDRYIEAGDLQKAKERVEQIQKASDDAGGFVGMYL